MSKENVLVQRRIGDAKRDDRDCVRVFLNLRARIGGGLRNFLCSRGPEGVRKEVR
jgi:hypothetical protein